MRIEIEYLRGNLEPPEGHYNLDAVQFEYERIAADLISQSYPDAEIVFRGQPASGGMAERIDSDGEIDEESIRADLARAFEEIDWQKCEA